MKHKRFPLTERLLISTGLLLTTTPQLLGHYFKLSDFVFGTIVGVGIALEIVAFIRLKRNKDTGYVC